MRNFYGFTIILLVASCHGGLVRRDVSQQPEQIPVQVIELAEGEDLNLPIVLAVQQKKETPSLEIVEPQTVILKNSVAEEKTPQVAENIIKELKEDKNLNNVEVLVEAERKKDQLLVEQEIIEAVKEENQQVLLDLDQTEVPKAEVKEPASEIENKKLVEIPEPIAIVEEKPQQVVEYKPAEQLKVVPLDAEKPVAVVAVAVEENVKQPVAIEVPAENPEETVPGLRQAITQPTPTQTSTQQNFLQQLIQPVGQFISQLTGGQQQQAAAATDSNAPAPPAPLPTLPGFLNPAVAFTSAQQAVQNAAQTVANSTSQAFQGLQQFASTLGTNVQNTLSGLGGQQQQQLSTSDVTTTRPPGPIQALISNFIGGGQQQQAAPQPLPGTGGGPFQGIISFFQGGNRPAVVAAVVSTTAEPVKVDLPTSAPNVNDKIDENAAQEETAAAVASNEVRVSSEVLDDTTEDSFEESQADELIVVNDDAETAPEHDSQTSN